MHRGSLTSIHANSRYLRHSKWLNLQCFNVEDPAAEAARTSEELRAPTRSYEDLEKCESNLDQKSGNPVPAVFAYDQL